MADHLHHRSHQLRERRSSVRFQLKCHKEFCFDELLCRTHQIPKLSRNGCAKYIFNDQQQSIIKTVPVQTLTYFCIRVRNMTFKRLYLPFIFVIITSSLNPVQIIAQKREKKKKNQYFLQPCVRSKLRTSSNWVSGEETIRYVENRCEQLSERLFKIMLFFSSDQEMWPQLPQATKFT